MNKQKKKKNELNSIGFSKMTNNINKNNNIIFNENNDKLLFDKENKMVKILIQK